ncbi:MAG: serine--tRNA ligase [Oscillospiraceae bacterium]|nr:serine--tRNA ligase [Oscillospiraceae bacterium]
MLDIRFIKENAEYVKRRLLTRNKDYGAEIDLLLSLDTERRALISDTETKKAKQNTISKQIPALKKAGEDTDRIFAEMKELSDECKADTDRISEIDAKIEDILLFIPNLPDESVPVGPDDSANVVVRSWGEPTKFAYEPKAHWDIGAELSILDPDTAAKITGARFHVYKGQGARLERSIVNFFLDTHTANGYTEIFPPYMVNRASMRGTGQLPKFEEDAFKVAGTDYFLIPTAEVPVTNMHRKEILSGDRLPIKYCAYTACFRAEAGSAGRDTRGLIRQHQFNKVELVKFCEPECSYDELESLTRDASALLEALGLPYRVSLLSTGDMGFSSAKTYDLEVWMPSYNRYVEISSCSNFVDYQARRAEIKYKKDIKDKTRLVHTLNGSGLAIGRTVAAILENYQNPDGTVTVPEVLRRYMGTDKIVKN